MFNEDIKQRYIDEKESEVIIPNSYLINQFRKTNDIEEELNKDISNFTTYEIIDFYKILNLSSFESLYVLNSQLSMYTQWCLQQNLVKDNQNHYLEITKDMLNGCINRAILSKKIVDRKTVLSWVRQLPNPKDQFIMLALFEFGKTKNFSDLVNVKITDLDGNNLTLNDGRRVEISEELTEIAKESYAEDTYYSATGKNVKRMPLVSTDGRIIKNYPNVSEEVSDFQLSRRIYNSITRSLDYVGVADWCSASSLAESGKIYMIKERAKELEITPREYLYSNYITEVERQFGCSIVKSNFSVKYEEYLV